MTKPSMEWIDKIFICLDEFYQERWRNLLPKSTPEYIIKLMWQSALYGCDYEEIRSALVLCKHSAKNLAAMPPHHLEFFRYCKGYTKPHIKPPELQPPINPEIAKGYLDEINSKIRYKKVKD